MRRRRLNIAAVLLVVLLVMTAVPAQVSAASGVKLVVGSQHSTDTDFNNAQTLDNLTIEGSGEAASLVFSGEEVTIRDSFEDGDIAEYSGDTSRFAVTSGNASNGTQKLVLDTSNYGSIARTDINLSRGEEYHADVNITNADDVAFVSFFAQSNTSNAERYWVRYNGSGGVELTYYDGSSGFVLDSVAVDGATLTDQWLTVEIHPQTDGTISATVLYENGSTAASLSAVNETLSSGGIGFAGNGGSAGDVTWDYARRPSTVDEPAKYISANHSVSNPEEAAINITQASNVSVNATVRTDGGTVLNQTTLTSTGNHTLALASASSDKLETVLNVSVTGTNPKFELGDESILFNNSAPTVDNSSASPTGNLSQQSITLSIDASDETFGTVQGDELTATFYVDGSQVGTDTLTSNGTASVAYEATTGGSHDWHVVVTDSYGESVTSDTFTFKAPSNIEFRKETSPSQLVDAVEVQVVAYYSGEVQKRNVTDGKLNLTGFPIDEPIIIRANASGYYTRTAVIESVYEQSNVYLLNDSRQSYLIRFELQDLTGSFPLADTVLFVERDIELNNSTEWRVIAGDNFGVQGVPIYLEQDERYRLRIKNLETGRTTVIGAFSPVQSETVTISTGGATIEIPPSEKNYGWAVEQNKSAQQINFRYTDDENATESVKLTIHERFNKSNVLVDNVTFTSANDISYSRSLTANESNQTWMAELYIDRGNGFMHFRQPLSTGTSIIPEGLDTVWLNGVGVFVMLVSSLAFSELNQGVGAIATALIGAVLWWFGVLSDIAIGPAIVVALMVAVIYHYYSNPSPGGGI